MRAITVDIKALVGRLGPVAVKALDLAIGLTMRAGGAEVTSDHLLRALLDLPDCDLCTAMAAAGVARVDVAARLDWHLRRLPGGHKGKPILAPMLLLMLQDAAALTSERVRTGHVAAALLADPGLSAAGIAALLAALPREPRHLQASAIEDRGEIGRVVAPPTPPPMVTPQPAAAAPPAAAPPLTAAASPPSPPARVEAPAATAGAATPRPGPANVVALRARFADRIVASDEGGLTLSARVGGRETTLRLAWDTEARVLVLRMALPADPPKDEVGAAVALSTLNNALPHGAFVLDEGRLAFRSHVFLDAAGNAPIETVAFAASVCEQAAEAVGAA